MKQFKLSHEPMGLASIERMTVLDKDLSFHKVYYAEECLQPSEFIAQYPKSTLC